MAPTRMPRSRSKADNLSARALLPTSTGWIGVGLAISVRPICAAPAKARDQSVQLVSAPALAAQQLQAFSVAQATAGGWLVV